MFNFCSVTKLLCSDSRCKVRHFSWHFKRNYPKVTRYFPHSCIGKCPRQDLCESRLRHSRITEQRTSRILPACGTWWMVLVGHAIDRRRCSRCRCSCLHAQSSEVVGSSDVLMCRGWHMVRHYRPTLKAKARPCHNLGTDRDSASDRAEAVNHLVSWWAF